MKITQKKIEKLVTKMNKAEKDKDIKTYNECVKAIQDIEYLQGY